MTRHGFAIASLLAVMGAPTALIAEAACPEKSEHLLFHSCWGEARASSLLLPEDGPVPATASGNAQERLIVTGGYTGKDARAEARPNPVGMFIHKGSVVNPTLARMDGVAILTPRGDLTIQHRGALAFRGDRFDLGEIEQRQSFQQAAASAGVSIFQSHLLIVDGLLDIRPREDAPRAVRRLLFTDDQGFGIYQTDRPVTLYDAARAVEAALSPDMVLNLDMGSFDYCLVTRGGVEQNCGVLARQNTSKLSNLLLLQLKPRG
ncbi:MAG: hypothetical protein AAFR17_06835 [Pseudomonadota bacterium]